MKILLAIVLCLTLRTVTAMDESDKSKLSEFKALIELSNDTAIDCKLHIKIYSDMDSEECRRVFDLKNKIMPSIKWYLNLIKSDKSNNWVTEASKINTNLNALGDKWSYIAVFYQSKYK